MAVFLFQDTQSMIIIVTVSSINTVIIFLSIKSTIKTQVEVDTSLLGEAILRAPDVIHGPCYS